MRYQLVDVVERWEGEGEVRLPTGACWHCGSAIAYCIQIRHIETGEQYEIGTTCAERVSLDAGALKRLLAAKYADDRAARAAWGRQAAAEAAAQAEAAATAQHGPHGTDARFISGCPCDECQAAAPHGITQRVGEAYRGRGPERVGAHNDGSGASHQRVCAEGCRCPGSCRPGSWATYGCGA